MARPRLDFEDDGGTPQWRARQRYVVASQRRGFIAWAKRQPPGRIALLALAVGLSGPAVIVVGLLLLVALGHMGIRLG
jgi:hypothetical protein